MIKDLFNQGRRPWLRTIALLAVALSLTLFDHGDSYVHRLSNQLAIIGYPVQWLVDMPIRLVKKIGYSLNTQTKLFADNEKLRARELLLQAKLQKLLALERENAQLRELLKSTTKIPGRVLVAELLAVNLDPNLQQVIVDKGSKDHIYQGQPVLDAYGVMGQMIAVEHLTSRLMLLTDSRSAIPVEDLRNGVRAVAAGLGRQNNLALINVPDTVQIKVGDVFVTSGLGLRYPAGYPVGVVTKVQHISGQKFAAIELTPAAHLAQTAQVLLVWPNNIKLYKALQQQPKAAR